MNLGQENERIEFKRSTGEMKEAMTSISAMLNKHQEGTIYFGVNNNGDVVGHNIGASTTRDLSRRIHEQIKPIPFVSVEILLDEGKPYIRVIVSGENVPYSANGKYYLRVSDEDREISQDQLKELFVKTVSTNERWENTLTEYDIGEINENQLMQYYNDGLTTKRFTDIYTTKENILSKLNLARDGYLTNAGYYLLSKNKPITLKTALFATDSKLTFLDQNHFQGNIFECIQEGITFISKSIRWAAEIGSMKRKEVPEIPIQAIREIVTNSFAHAKYQNILSSHEIDVFPSKVTIFNPGNLLPGIDPKKVAEGIESPVIRNPNIANMLFRANFIEAFGTGFNRVFTLCKEANIKYNYFNNSTGFMFEFMRAPIIQIQNEEEKNDLSEVQKFIIAVIKNNNKTTISELSKMLLKSNKTVQRTLEDLTEKGFLKREGSSRSGHWIVLK